MARDIKVTYGSQFITLTMPIEEAEEISDGLSDILCWCQGFRAAGGKPPMGEEDARSLNIAIKRALSQHDRMIRAGAK